MWCDGELIGGAAGGGLGRVRVLVIWELMRGSRVVGIDKGGRRWGVEGVVRVRGWGCMSDGRQRCGQSRQSLAGSWAHAFFVSEPLPSPFLISSCPSQRRHGRPALKGHAVEKARSKGEEGNGVTADGEATDGQGEGAGAGAGPGVGADAGAGAGTGDGDGERGAKRARTKG